MASSVLLELGDGTHKTRLARDTDPLGLRKQADASMPGLVTSADPRVEAFRKLNPERPRIGTSNDSS